MLVTDVNLTGTAHAQFYRHMFPPCSRIKFSKTKSTTYVIFTGTTALLHVFPLQKNPANTTSAFLFQTRESILTLRDKKQGMARL